MRRCTVFGFPAKSPRTRSSCFHHHIVLAAQRWKSTDITSSAFSSFLRDGRGASKASPHGPFIESTAPVFFRPQILWRRAHTSQLRGRIVRRHKSAGSAGTRFFSVERAAPRPRECSTRQKWGNLERQKLPPGRQNAFNMVMFFRWHFCFSIFCDFEFIYSSKVVTAMKLR